MRYDPRDTSSRTRERVLKPRPPRRSVPTGPHQMSVWPTVMAKAGLTHGGFYAHFANRDDMLGAAIGKMFEDAGARFLKVGDGEADPGLALHAYVDFYLSAAHRDTRTSGCPLPFLSADAPRLPVASREAFAAGVERLTARIAVQLNRMNHPRPSATASSVLSEMVGAVALARADPDLARSDQRLASSRISVKQRLGLEVTP